MASLKNEEGGVMGPCTRPTSIKSRYSDKTVDEHTTQNRSDENEPAEGLGKRERFSSFFI